MNPPLRVPALSLLLQERRAEQLRQAQLMHLVWLLGAQLFALGGGEDYPVPDPLREYIRTPGADRSAAQIRDDLLRRLRQSTGKETSHGSAV